MATKRSGKSFTAARVASRALPRNLLLATLPAADLERVLLAMEVVPLPLKHYLHKAGERIHHVYFPEGGFCSVVTILEDGSMVEVATVGREGATGMTAALGSRPEASATMVQGEADRCYRIPVDAFRREMDLRGAFYTLMTRYAQAFLDVVMRTTACNAVHTIEQRLARWLLMAHDRMDADEFPLTQEFVAMMLAATRPTVSVVAGSLQKAGLITYRRGRVTVLNRKRLEAASCACYRVSADLLRSVISR